MLYNSGMEGQLVNWPYISQENQPQINKNDGGVEEREKDRKQNKEKRGMIITKIHRENDETMKLPKKTKENNTNTYSDVIAPWQQRFLLGTGLPLSNV